MALRLPSSGSVGLSHLLDFARLVSIFHERARMESSLWVSVSRFFNCVFLFLFFLLSYKDVGYDIIFDVLFIVLEIGAQSFVTVLIFTVGSEQRNLCFGACNCRVPWRWYLTRSHTVTAGSWVSVTQGCVPSMRSHTVPAPSWISVTHGPAAAPALCCSEKHDSHLPTLELA